ncbi:E3 ubiquitin-protein ligase TRIM71-like [Anneissia japonica]|uniref:E3 ubiquitin-protein ligase TRIM71-like n=1 Tax=Anneissia japonica TaxID=1529436 RepID=UPI00142556B8|nr:E3 ubiquitin-protein ligase TRIM71-like [Anneissia japonica]
MAMQGNEIYHIKTEALRCGDCRVELKNTLKQIPKFLKCLHAFCGKCILKMMNGSLVCPVCKLLADVSGDTTIDDLADISFLKNIEQFDRIMDQLGQDFGSKHVHPECQNCSDGNAATYWCADLDGPLLFCNECVSIDNKFQTSGQKDFRSLRNTRPDDILTCVRLSSDGRCLEHDEDLEFFCEECATPICHICDHDGHPMMSIREQANTIRGKIDDKVKDSEKTIEILQRRLRYVENEKELLKQSSHLTAQHVNLFFDKLKESIEKRRKHLLNTVSNTGSKTLKILKEDTEHTQSELNDVTRFTEFLSAARNFSNDCDLMLMNESLKTRSGDHISKRVSDEPDANGLISFGLGEFTDIELPLLQSSHFEVMLKKVPMSIAKLGEINGTATVASETKFRIRENATGIEIVIEAYTKNQQPCTTGGDSFTIEIKDPNGTIHKPLLEDDNTGTYSTNFTPKLVGKHQVSITFHGRPISRSPYTFEMEESPKPQRKPYDSKYINVSNLWDVKEFPDRDPPPPPVPSSPRPTSADYMIMKSFKAPPVVLKSYTSTGRNDLFRQRSATTTSLMTKNEQKECAADDYLDIHSYHGTRRESRRGSYIYQTIDSLGLDVKEEGENAGKKLEALHEKFISSTKRKRKISLMKWRKSQTD